VAIENCVNPLGKPQKTKPRSDFSCAGVPNPLYVRNHGPKTRCFIQPTRESDKSQTYSRSRECLFSFYWVLGAGLVPAPEPNAPEAAADSCRNAGVSSRVPHRRDPQISLRAGIGLERHFDVFAGEIDYDLGKLCAWHRFGELAGSLPDDPVNFGREKVIEIFCRPAFPFECAD
jgi:hypothetical protein